MLSPRWRKVLRDLWSNKTRTLLVVLSIAVGVFAVGMIASSQMILSTDLNRAFLETNPAHATLYGSFDDAMVQSVRRMDGVAEVEARGRMSMQLQVGPDQWKDLRLTTIPDYEEMRVAKIYPVSGAWPPDGEQLLVERASLALTNAQVGDTVTVELADGKRRELTIAGVVHDLGEPSSTFDPVVKGYITQETQEWLGGGRSYGELNLRVSGDATDKGHITEVANEVKSKIERAGQRVGWTWIPEPGEHWANETLQPMMLILGVLGFLSLLLSGFLVVNTISALLSQQVRQIGVMKAIGARSGQLVQMYLASVLIFGALSLLIAVPLGAWAAYAFVNFTAGLLNFYEIPFRIPPRALALESAVGLMVPLLAALWPVFEGARITVREAISSYGLGKGNFGSNWIDRLLERVRGLSRPMLLSLRNTFRRKGRLLLTLSTLVLGGAIFIAVLSVHASLLTTLDDALAYWAYDIEVQLARPYRIEQIEEEALRVPGVTGAESWIGNSARRVRDDGTESPNIFLLAPPADTEMINPNLLEGRWLLPDDENAIVINSIVLDEDPDIGVGDSVTLSMEGRESEWTVVGIVQGVLSGPIAYANYPYFAREMRFVGRAGRVQLVTSTDDPQEQLQIAAALTEHFESIGLRVSSTQTLAELRDTIVQQFNIIVVFLAIMALLIAVVGALGLMGTMSINVLERSREIGVMRAIGASDGSVLQIFLVEGILIGVMSWFAGTLLSLPISKLLSDVVGVSFVDAPLSYTFSTNGALLWLGLVLLLASLSSLLPAWHATRLTVRDVLAYE